MIRVFIIRDRASVRASVRLRTDALAPHPLYTLNALDNLLEQVWGRVSKEQMALLHG